MEFKSNRKGYHLRKFFGSLVTVTTTIVRIANPKIAPKGYSGITWVPIISTSSVNSGIKKEKEELSESDTML